MNKVSFGFRDVSPDEKTKRVKDVFSSVAHKYDLMNDVMSGGIHRLWKRELLRILRLEPGMQHIDVAGGTGDISFLISEQIPRIQITLCDLNDNMLRVGQERADKKKLTNDIQWVCCDAAHLPLPDRTFHAYTIAFGLRNVTEIDLSLQEAYRTLKPGGQYLCLEFSQVVLPLLNELYEKYSFKLIPKLGQWIAKDQDSYQYLVESIARFPTQEILKEKIEAAGFKHVTYQNLAGGIACIHSGWRI
jgi:ubiquinone/menaquinone biosynthesis methyltransferase